ncbi:MAG: hemolysin family protein [Bacillota bacterium]
MDNESLLTLIGIIVLLSLSAFFSASETAYSSLNRTRIKIMSQNGSRRASLVLKLSEKYDSLLSTLLIGNNIVNIAISAIGTVWFVDRLGNAGAAVSTLVMTIIVLIFGEISPKSLAKESPERLAISVAPVLKLLITLLYPVNQMFMYWKRLLSRIFQNSETTRVTEGELLTLVDEAHEDGGIDEEEKNLIRNIFEFDDLTAGEIATHRTEVSLLWMDESVEQWEQTIHDSRHSLYPVCDETVDDVVGVLNAKDYFRLSDRSRKSIMEQAVKPAYFIPQSVKADILFRNMKRVREHMGVVLDEYGGMLGIVTMNDLVEQLVGKFDKNTDTSISTPLIDRIDSKTWKIHGSAPLDKVAEALGVALPCEDYDTFGGLVFGALGEIPEDGSRFELETEGLVIKVTEITEHRIEKAIVCLEEPELDRCK